MENENSNVKLVKYGIVAACAAGAYLIWNNRVKIQKFLSEQGVSVPDIKRTLSEAVHSGAEKIRGDRDSPSSKQLHS